jgi:hypothetical protein
MNTENSKQQEEKDKAELDAIAKKHGVEKVSQIFANKPDCEPISAFFKRPDRKIMGMVMSLDKTNPLRAKEILLTNCFLEGDRRILTDDDYFFSACTRAYDTFEIMDADIKKN